MIEKYVDDIKKINNAMLKANVMSINPVETYTRVIHSIFKEEYYRKRGKAVKIVTVTDCKVSKGSMEPKWIAHSISNLSRTSIITEVRLHIKPDTIAKWVDYINKYGEKDFYYTVLCNKVLEVEITIDYQKTSELPDLLRLVHIDDNITYLNLMDLLTGLGCIDSYRSRELAKGYRFMLPTSRFRGMENPKFASRAKYKADSERADWIDDICRKVCNRLIEFECERKRLRGHEDYRYFN